jgi:hypothetical protein
MGTVGKMNVVYERPLDHVVPSYDTTLRFTVTYAGVPPRMLTQCRIDDLVIIINASVHPYLCDRVILSDIERHYLIKIH